MAVAVYKIEVDWDNDGDFLDADEDITADVKSISYSRGKDEELGRANPGTLSIRVNNADGKYSPTKNSGIYTDLKPKRVIRVTSRLNDPAWLSDWAKRIKLTIDNADIDSALSNFPILVYLSTSSGRNNDDISAVFDELTADGNRKKIAITTSDGVTELYVEIEKWDDANEKAWLWVKVPSVASGVDTELYLYYDVNHADNTAYVGDPNSTPAENVWDSNFKLVTHMRDDPNTSSIRDSTSNNNDGTKKGAGEPAVTTSGKIADAQDFDGADDYVNCGSGASLDNIAIKTIAMWFKLISYGSTDDARLMAKADLDAGFTLLVRGGANKFLQFGQDFSTSIGWWGTPVDSLTLGAWYYAAFVYDRSSDANDPLMYINGVSQAITELVTPSGTPVSDAAQDLLLGVRSDSHGDFDGIIDEVRISDTARNAAWFKASYESERDDLLDFGSEESLYNLFYGYIETITPHPDPASQDCYISAIDGLDYLARHELDTVLYKDTVTGTLVTNILDAAAWSASLRSIDAGQDTVPFAHWSKVRALTALEDIEDSELGFKYINGTGELCWEDRHHRYSATHQTSQATFDDTMVDIVYDYSARNIYNEVRATVTPWELKTIAELWKLEEVPGIAAGGTKTFWGDATIEGIPVFVDAWTTPVSTTDYTANTQADGSGVDKTGDIAIVTTKLAKVIKLAVTNNAGVIVYITLLKARGTYYDSFTKVSKKSEDSTSQTAYQKRTLSLDGKYLTDADKAQDFCDYGIARFKDPQAEVVITIVNKNVTNLTQILSREISDRITVKNTKLGLDADFFINKMTHEITRGGKQHLCRWYLVDAENEDFWSLNYSVLGTGTKLGY